MPNEIGRKVLVFVTDLHDPCGRAFAERIFPPHVIQERFGPEGGTSPVMKGASSFCLPIDKFAPDESGQELLSKADISVVVVANFGDAYERLQIDAILLKIASDVRYARDLALTEGRGSRVYIDVSNNKYYLKWDDESYMQNPIGGGNFVIQLGQGNFSKVQITGTDFSNGGQLDFGTSGAPKNAGASFQGELKLVSINDAKQVIITANTGFVRIEDY